MIQSFRENMKNTAVVVIVVLFFIVPMVLTGVGDSFLGSVAGRTAASVGETTISTAELRRAIYFRKQSILSQGNVDADAEFLKDENLRGPVLEQLTRRAAVVESLKNGGMDISDSEVSKSIVDQEQFYIDNKFNVQAYRRILANVGYTPATYKVAIKGDLVINQINSGLNNSSFITDSEIDLFMGLLQQKRTFDLVSISQDKVKETISVTDEEVAEYFEQNKNSYKDPEKVSVTYIELSVDDLTKDIEVSEEEIRAQFENEIEDFESSTEYKISHILIDPSLEDADDKIKTVQQKISAGEAFEDLVKTYSDDKFSLPLNGDLGVLDTEAYSDEFNDAVYALEVGSVSAPVESDLGTHFIKLTSKEEKEAPKFDDRKLAIESNLRAAEAEELYIEKLELLKELVFNAEDLGEPASVAGLEVKTSDLFTQGVGLGIAKNQAVRQAAFKNEVLNEGYNSEVIELNNKQAVVIRKNEHIPEAVKPFESVKEGIKTTLERNKLVEALTEKAETFIEAAKSSDNLQALATKFEYTHKRFDAVKNTNPDIEPEVSRKVFSMEKGVETSFDSLQARNGDYKVIVLSDVILGQRDDAEDSQMQLLSGQLSNQNSSFEVSSFETASASSIKVKIN